MRFRSTGDEGLGIIVLNNNPIGGLDQEPAGVRVVREDGGWTALFPDDRADRRAVQDAGFRFDPIERRWHTSDPTVAARVDQDLRSELDRQKAELERGVERRPVIVITPRRGPRVPVYIQRGRGKS